MIRKLTLDITLDSLEAEVIYSRAALEVDENAADFLERTSSWLTRLDEVRGFERKVREVVATSAARRVVANDHLDAEVSSFGIDLLAAVRGDRSALRFTQFFSVAPSEFIRQPLADEVAEVKNWLTAISDSVLETHREALEKWTATADSALTESRAAGSQRDQLWQKRQGLADFLTSERDTLHSLLVQRATERGLSRYWADLFFLKGKSAESSEVESTSKPS